MPFATIDALRESLARPATKVRTPEYVAKMLHDVPKAAAVDRLKFITERCAGKRVLELGASGHAHTEIANVAGELVAIDREDGDGIVGFDLDDVRHLWLPIRLGDFAPDVIVCGEVLEHLSNPGYLLARLRKQFDQAPVIVTVPNAFSAAAAQHMEHGTENVNLDHTCWFSYRTLRTLLERAGYAIAEFYWYGGEPLTAEGLIVVAE